MFKTAKTIMAGSKTPFSGINKKSELSNVIYKVTPGVKGLKGRNELEEKMKPS